MPENRDLYGVVGQLFETGSQWVIEAVCNGVYAAEHPVPASEEYPDGWHRHVIVSVGSLEPNSRYVFLGDFPTFPKRDASESPPDSAGAWMGSNGVEIHVHKSQNAGLVYSVLNDFGDYNELGFKVFDLTRRFPGVRWQKAQFPLAT